MAQFLLHCYPKLARHETRQLIDTSGRKLVLLVSDCRSQLWQNGSIHEWLREWSKQGPTAIAQVLPERLWRETELDVGFPVQASSLIPGAANAKLNLRGLSPRQRQQIEDPLTVPIVTLSAPSLQQLARVVAAMGNQRVPARIFDLVWVKAEDRQKDSVMPPAASAEAKVDLFEATASPVARELASYMAAVPVNMSVINLLQKHLAKYATLFTLRKFMAAACSCGKHHPQALRGMEMTLKPMILRRGYGRFSISARRWIARRTPLSAFPGNCAGVGAGEYQKFTALLTPKPGWTPEQKAQILPFAQIATEVLRNLGGDYALLAAEVERDARRQKTGSSHQLHFHRRRNWSLRRHSSSRLRKRLQRKLVFRHRCKRGSLSFSPSNWSQLPIWVALGKTMNLRQRPSDAKNGKGYLGCLAVPGGLSGREANRPEPFVKVQLSDDVLLEMVAVPGGTFTMGSPQDEPERNSDEGPQREVTVSSLLMGRYPVTKLSGRQLPHSPRSNENSMRTHPDSKEAIAPSNECLGMTRWNFAIAYRP